MKKDRTETALKMKEEHDKLTPHQKLEKMDKKFGKGLGGKKERARLEALIGCKK